MNVLTIAPEDRQITLLDILPVYNCKDNASARNAYGTAAQEIVCRTLKIAPIPINGNFDVCFDAKGADCHFEIKSVRRGGKLVLYDFRLEKEKNSGCCFKYAILIHNLRNARNDILTAMVNSRPEILVVDGLKVHEVAMTFPLRKIQKEYIERGKESYNGYTREGYRDGYRNVSVNAVRPFAKSIPVETLFL